MGLTITGDIQDAIPKIPTDAWAQAYDGDGEALHRAWFAEITGMPDLGGWPEGRRVIVRKERPHPGAQLRFTGIGGYRFTCLAPARRAGGSRTWSSGTAAGRCGDRKDPPRQGHRPAYPAAEGVRAEPALARDRRAGPRAAGLDADAHPRRPGQPLGAEAAPAAGLRRSGGGWCAAGAACGCDSLNAGPALSPRDHSRYQQAAGPPVRLTSRNHPATRKEKPPGPVSLAHPAGQARPGTGNSLPTPQANQPDSPKD